MSNWYDWSLLAAKSYFLLLWCCSVANEELRTQFAEQANVGGPWIEQQHEYVATLGLQASGSLEVSLLCPGGKSSFLQTSCSLGSAD